MVHEEKTVNKGKREENIGKQTKRKGEDKRNMEDSSEHIYTDLIRTYQNNNAGN